MTNYNKKKAAMRAKLDLLFHEMRLEMLREIQEKLDTGKAEFRVNIDQGLPMYIDEDIMSDAISIQAGRVMNAMDRCRDLINSANGDADQV